MVTSNGDKVVLDDINTKYQKNSRLLLPHNVSKLEATLFVAGWMSVYGYAAYNLYTDSKEYQKHPIYSIQYYFRPGWPSLNRKQDVTNTEWQFWRNMFLNRMLYWFLGHVFVARISELLQWQCKQLVFIVYGMVAVTYITGYWSMLITISHCLLMYMVMKLGRRWLVWTVDLALIATINYHPFTTHQESLFPTESDYLLFNYSLAITCHRYLAFCLENVDNPREASLQDMCLYVFYFPLYFCGPLINYDKFKQQFNATDRITWNISKCVYGIYRICRVLLWAYFIEFIIHYLYFSAMHENKKFLRSANLWTMAGLDFCQGQFFQVIYVVFFGLPSQIAALDGIQTVATPRCVATICYYSDMWKKFDRGLHEFLKKYIYIACGGNRRGYAWQLGTSLLCFLYVGYWHGGNRALFYWVLLNYVQVSGEALLSTLYRRPHIQHLIQSKLSKENIRRIQGVLTVPLLAASLVSIHSFFDDMDVCWIYIQRFLLHGNVWYYVVTFVSLYFFTQCSLEADIWEAYFNGKIPSVWQNDNKRLE